MVIDYTIAVGTFPEQLNDSVKALLAKGWQPTGGVAANTDKEGSSYLLQAMIKKEKKK